MIHSIQLPRTFVIAFLALAYILGFLITPYWSLHKSIEDKILYLVVTILLGIIWVRLSASSFPVEWSRRDITLILLLFAGGIALNYLALNSVIPFRGDEALHIERTLAVVSRIPFLASLVIGTLCALFLISGLMQKRGWMIGTGVLIVASLIAFFIGENSFQDMQQYPHFFLRYPFINYWLFAALPKLTSLVASPYHEALYRVISTLSMISTAWIVQKKLNISGWMNAIAWGFAVMTVPLVLYYSSILYIEPPAVFLMTLVCLDINNLLHKSSQEISSLPSWYALLLIGFIKETTIPFFLGFIAMRLLVQLQTWFKSNREEGQKQSLLALFSGEIAIIFILLTPLLLYLYFRAALTSTRGFEPRLINLFDPMNYYFVIRSFVEQFGLFLVFFIAGCLLLLRNRQFASVFCYLALIAAVLAFHIMDYKVYAGYSRFNLFNLPPILAGSAVFIKWAIKRKQYIGVVLVAAAIVSNLLLSPVNIDGAKVPFWGNYLIDTSEHYYPYQDALLWLKKNQAGKRMLFTGLDFYYPFQFYWNKLDWKPKRDGIRSEEYSGDETIAISQILDKAERERYQVVIYRVLEENVKLPEQTGEFRTQVIKNSAHTLIIFYKP